MSDLEEYSSTKSGAHESELSEHQENRFKTSIQNSDRCMKEDGDSKWAESSFRQQFSSVYFNPFFISSL